ncbi:hypothetical protein Ancab_006062 [Ancistrocladus abbreviatus]
MARQQQKKFPSHVFMLILLFSIIIFQAVSAARPFLHGFDQNRPEGLTRPSRSPRFQNNVSGDSSDEDARANDFGSLFLSMLPKGCAPPSGPSLQTDDNLNN